MINGSQTEPSIRDSWQTPQWLFDYTHKMWDFDIDLAASKTNTKLPTFFSMADDALAKPWHKHGRRGWCNPPYSKIGPWLEKAFNESLRGFETVLLVPTPNGEAYWHDHVFGKASQIAFIKGRIGFELPVAGGLPKAKSGNPRGLCLVIYRHEAFGGLTKIETINRDDMKR